MRPQKPFPARIDTLAVGFVAPGINGRQLEAASWLPNKQLSESSRKEAGFVLQLTYEAPLRQANNRFGRGSTAVWRCRRPVARTIDLARHRARQPDAELTAEFKGKSRSSSARRHAGDAPRWQHARDEHGRRYG